MEPDQNADLEHLPGRPNLRVPISGESSTAALIDPLVKPGELYSPLKDRKVHCYACAHNCTIGPGKRGICQVRYNLEGVLYVPHGYVAALQCDPTEKKPFFHVYPGSDTLTFGMLGCDLHCSYCQNWDTSQALRDANAGRPILRMNPEEMVSLAQRNGAACVASSYNEPLITTEWAVEIFRQARSVGFTGLFVSNGNATRQALEYLRPYAEGYKIDLKTMDDSRYRQLGAVRDHVLDGIRMAYDLGYWVEIVTLIIPGFNDSERELQEAARFLHSISPDIPWHVTAFHPDYRMRDAANTPAKKLIRAVEIGYQAGLRYVYAGNLPGRVGPYEDTRCPTCQKTLIRRLGFVILEYALRGDGTCPSCDTRIAGIWPDNPGDVRLGSEMDIYYRVPRRPR